MKYSNNSVSSEQDWRFNKGKTRRLPLERFKGLNFLKKNDSDHKKQIWSL
jgi:hypothetical protein